MGFLIFSFFVATATAASVYVSSTSILLAFLAYGAAGALVLLSALIAEAMQTEQAENLPA